MENNKVKWTKEQVEAINEKNSNILVAAAAGSGKTAVLVERIINKIINEKIDIDRILLVTFTNAAAAEMRERILSALYKKIDEEPENKDLQRQITLLSRASICTIHSFCLEVIKNNFYELDISPNFRIGEETELEIIKNDCLEELFENKYENEDKDFLKLIEYYTGYRNDEDLKQLILTIYRYIQSSPYPEIWIEEKIKEFDLKEKLNEDFSNTIWGKIIIKNIQKQLESNIITLTSVKNELKKLPEFEKFYNTICNDIIEYERLQKIEEWDKLSENISNFKLGNWSKNSKVDLDIKERSKKIRDDAKDSINKYKNGIMQYNSKMANEEIYAMYEILNSLKNLILEFSQKFSEEKKKRNLIDFNDIEHFALKILENEEIAKKYKDKFIEIAIDEYQDSNLIQEKILTTISNGKNIFMVGDVKQSIYKFRQARPDLFMEKYENYDFVNDFNEKSKGKKIQLFKNFRSMSNILDITNLIFNNIMSKELGEIEYTEEEYLNICENYEKISLEKPTKSELNIINLGEEIIEEKEYKEDNDDEDDEETEEVEEPIENTVLEARLVVKKIKELMKSNYKVYDKEVGYRNLKYKDIVILLRSTSVQAQIYEKELTKENIPVFTDTNNQFLDTIEIQTIMSLLKIIDNPIQDIPLVTVLRSIIGGFTDNELIEIRINNYNISFYEAMIKYKTQENADKKIIEKIDNLFNMLDKFRKEKEYLPLNELIWKIYIDTGFYNYVTLMPNGLIRQANLKLLFEKAKKYESASFKGLYNFINFINKMKTRNEDFGSAKLIGENEDVVRIMSIHKSKGLEFPICFLCSTGKQFNFQDLRENILLHQNIGFGPKYIDVERKIENNTLAKEAIKIKMKEETLAEEMRILYVALTRAKEKLIITGISKNLEEETKNKQNLLKLYSTKDNSKINPNIVSKCKSYLEWINLVYLNNKDKISDILELNTYNKQELIDTSKEGIEAEDFIKKLESVNIENKNTEKINSLLQWQYKYKDLSKIETKSSVTKIKQMQNGEEETFENELSTPKFLSEEIRITNAQIGTLIHLCFKNLDFNLEYSEEKIKELVNSLYEKEIITKQEMESIDINQILKFTKSNLWNELKNAKKVYKELPFYINIPVNELYSDIPKTEDKILVQGIIDLYFIDENDNVVLVDYKTDFIKQGQENILVERYKKQLDLYKNALEHALNKKVDKVLIYSVCLNKVIEAHMGT